jgi:hypothetical protein
MRCKGLAPSFETYVRTIPDSSESDPHKSVTVYLTEITTSVAVMSSANGLLR